MAMVEPFVALVIYPTTPDGQSRQADNLARIASAKIRELPGFLPARVFGSGPLAPPARDRRGALSRAPVRGGM